MSNKTGAKRKKVTSKNQETTSTEHMQVVDTGRLESPVVVPSKEVRDEFGERKKPGVNVRSNFPKHITEDTRSKFLPDAKIVAGNDPDGDLIEASMSGDSSVVGGNPTPDQSDVDVIGEAVGLEYQDNEELSTLDKIESRDIYRWELEPESSEDYEQRTRELSKRKQP